jgi:hypothetical protein
VSRLDSKPVRATRDPAVIAAWEQAVLAYKGKHRYLQPALMIGMLVSFILIFKIAYLVFLFFFLFAALILVRMLEKHALACPHCARNPVSLFGPESPLDAEFCKHCLYWLKPPF